ncbi:MAG: preprotein translocase subunit Sec61beta [Candidatus Micrarchaeota archaeon]|nr:preprotein translocase subunit Sec61beta [Candidatus Micrarchaeota archaeon]
MAQEKIQAPSTSAGLMRFYDVTSSNIQINPQIVVGASIAVILLELILQVIFK